MKAKFLIPILAGGLSMTPKLSAAYPDTVLADNPLGYWRLGEADTNSGAINIGSLGAEATGTFDNDPLPGVEGIVAGDTAVYFDSADDKIEVPFVPELNPSGPFTVEIWAKAVMGSTHRASMASRDDTPVGTSAGYILYLNPDNNWQFWVGTGGA